ncbi:gag-pol polyprotein [Cucumis melo var. makuwa]|uniref:Gag-pol polyprotein n=1 Tax=Cucumis melo var. makuwa TaxID=1194695 RepID=A0A5A7TXI4_CUCMM|nr:gag-pol polyprotein [Cucumis melo var. makuwa]
MVGNYIVEEAIEFCYEFIAGVSSIGLNSSVIKRDSNVDRALSTSSFIRPSEEQLDQAHLYVIQNVNDVYHTSNNIWGVCVSLTLLKLEVKSGFKKSIIAHSFALALKVPKNSITPSLRWIAHGPSLNVATYYGYLINGYYYHTKRRDDIRRVQNSGVSITATTISRAKVDELGFTIVDLKRMGKPRMIFFIKMLDGKAWRALVEGYDPPMITVNGVLVPKREVDWTDAEEQASVGNARAPNTIFNGVDLNVFKLINSCSTAKEAWKTLEEVYEVTAIEEAHDITTLKLDELFGSLLTFEMATVDRDSKKGKRIAFKSTHVDEEANATRMNAQTSNLYRRRNDDSLTRRNNENSNRRSDGYIKKKDGDRRIFKCRECGGVGHYQVECPTFMRKQKKNFCVTLSDEESGDSRDDNDNINAFTIRITDENTDDERECSEERKNDELTIEKLEAFWKEDCEARQYKKKGYKIL